MPAIVSGILMLRFLTSVALKHNSQTNMIVKVIVAKEVIVRQDNGENYQPSFTEPLHKGTEFVLLENRPGLFQIKLSDDSNGWIPENAAELI